MDKLCEKMINSLNNLVNKLSDESINNDNSLTPIIDELKTIIQSITKDSIIYSQVKKEIANSKKQLDKLNEDETKKIESRFNRLVKTNIYTSKINSFNIDKKIKEQIENTNNLYKLNKEKQALITSTTNPKIYSDLIDRNASIEIYNNNKNEYLSRYDNIVNKTIVERNKYNNDVISLNNKNMFSYNEASKNVINDMNKKSKIINDKLTKIDNILNDLKNSFEKKNIEIEKNFNKEVLKINRIITNYQNDAKDLYEKNKSIAQNDKANTDIKNAQSRSNIIKEFATSIAKENDNYDKLKYNQLLHTNKNTSICETNIFDINAKIRKINEDVINNKAPSDYKAKIRLLNKQKKLEVRALKAKLKIINNYYYSRFDFIEKQKYIYEAIKNKQIKKIDHITTIEDNSFHNKLHIYQQEYDYEIDRLNRKYDYEVKRLRSKYDEEKLEVLKEYRIKQINLFKKKQAFTHEANLINDEIEMANTLEEQVTKNNRDLINNDISKSNINSLLEIEKNGMLTDYHISYIDNLINIENEKFQYKETINFLERDKKIDIINVNLKKASIQLDHLKIIYGLEKEKINIKERFQEQSYEIVHSEQFGTMKANHIYANFNNTNKSLLSIYNVLSRYIYSMNNISIRLLNTASSYKLSGTNSERFSSILRSIIKYINISLISVNNMASDELNKIINQQISLETGAKFNQLFEALDRENNTSLQEINEREENLNKTIQNYNNGIRHFYSQISAIDAKLENRSSYSTHEINELKNERKHLLLMINKNESTIDIFKLQLKKIPKIKNTLEQEYNKKKQRLHKKRQDEAAILFDALNDYKKLFDSINTIETGYISIVDPSNFITHAKFMKLVSNYQHKTTIKYNKLFSSYLEILTKLTDNIVERYTKLLKQNNSSYIAQEAIINRHYKKRLQSVEDKIDDENEYYSNKIKDNNNEMSSLLDKYKKDYDDIKDKYEKTIKNIDVNIHALHKDFYTKTSAIRISLINNLEKSAINKELLNEDNNVQNKNIINKYVTHREDLIADNKKTLEEYDVTINHIPLEFKNYINNLKEEFVNYKKQYDTNNKNILNEHNREIKNKNRTALRYSNSIHNKIIKINSSISKKIKALAE